MEKYDLIDNLSQGRYEYRIGESTPHIEYSIEKPGTIYLTHTYVPDELRGRGIATRLVEDVLADVARRGLKVVPLCFFVEEYVDGHPEWKRLLA